MIRKSGFTKGNKYHAKRTTVDGISFASGAEANRYRELKLLAKAGRIRNLELQPVFRYESERTGKVLFRYIADFSYDRADKGAWPRIVEDVKGLETSTFKLKKKLIEDRFFIEIEIVKNR